MSVIDPLLRANEVTAMLRISHASLYRRVKDGTLPKPVKLGAASRWNKSDIIAAISASPNGGAHG